MTNKFEVLQPTSLSRRAFLRRLAYTTAGSVAALTACASPPLPSPTNETSTPLPLKKLFSFDHKNRPVTKAALNPETKEDGPTSNIAYANPLAQLEFKPVVEAAIKSNPFVRQVCQENDHEIVITIWYGQIRDQSILPGFTVEKGQETFIYLTPLAKTATILTDMDPIKYLPHFKGTNEDLAEAALAVVAEEELLHACANGSQELSATQLTQITAKPTKPGHYRSRGFRIQTLNGDDIIAENDVVEEAVVSLAISGYSTNRSARIFDPFDFFSHLYALTLLDHTDSTFTAQALRLKAQGNLPGFAQLMHQTFETGLEIHLADGIQNGLTKAERVKLIATDMTTGFFATTFESDPDTAFHQVAKRNGFHFPNSPMKKIVP